MRPRDPNVRRSTKVRDLKELAQVRLVGRALRRVCADIEAGMTVGQALGSSGIRRSAWATWDGMYPHLKVRERIVRAREMGKGKAAKALYKRGLKDDTKALVKWLEANDVKTYGRQAGANVSVNMRFGGQRGPWFMSVLPGQPGVPALPGPDTIDAEYKEKGNEG